MMGFVGGIIGDVVDYIKANELEKAQQLLDRKLAEMRVAEVSDRRHRVDEINRSIVQIDIETKKIDIQYQLIKTKVPLAMVHSIDDYLKSLKKKRATLESEKRLRKRGDGSGASKPKEHLNS